MWLRAYWSGTGLCEPRRWHCPSRHGSCAPPPLRAPPTNAAARSAATWNRNTSSGVERGLSRLLKQTAYKKPHKNKQINQQQNNMRLWPLVFSWPTYISTLNVPSRNKEGIWIKVCEEVNNYDRCDPIAFYKSRCIQTDHKDQGSSAVIYWFTWAVCGELTLQIILGHL